MSTAPARCIVCGDAPEPGVQRAGVAWVRSPGCGLEWRDSFPDDDELETLYGPGYLDRWGATDAESLASVRAMKHATHRDFLRSIRAHRGSGRLLDVGCATGFLLEVACESGFDVYGIDRNPEGVRAAEERFGDRVTCGRLADEPFSGVTFDVVTLIDVLEHVPDPALLLDAIRARLTPGGVMAAVLPNAASFTRRTLGSRWPHYVPEHLFQWTPESLARFLSDRGWRVRELRVGIRKTFTGHYLAACSACAGSSLPPGASLLGDRFLRLPTGEMLAIASPAWGAGKLQ